MAIITLTRGTYSGAKGLAEYAAGKLDYSLFSREDVIAQMTCYGWEEEKLNKARYKQLGFMERMNLQWVHYLACLRAVLAEKAVDEALIYHGNQGQVVLRDFPHVLSVKCVADMEYRIQAVLERNEYAIDRKEAMKIINRVDQRRDRWSRVLHGNHIDQDSYHLVIDLSKTSVADAFEIIKSHISLPQFQPTPESRNMIEDMTVAAKLRARIAMEADVLDDDLEIEIRDGVVNIKGTVHSEEDAVAIRKFLCQQPEIHDVETLLDTAHDEPAEAHAFH